MKKIILKSFIGKILLLILPIIILYTVLFYSGYWPVLSNSISFDAKTYELNRIKLKHADILAIGSSVALNDLNTKIIKDNTSLSYYNFASWNLQVEDDYFLLKHYVFKYKPKYVILLSTMHDFTFEPNTSLPANLDLNGRMLGYYYIKNFANLNEIIKRKNALDLSTKDNNRYDCLRFDEGGGVELQLTTLSPKRLKEYLGDFPNKKNTPKAYQNLINLANFLKYNRVMLIYIQAPYRKSFVNSQALMDTVKAHFARCKFIVESNGGLYLNYHDFFEPADSGMYVDPSHLSGAGSKVFTQKVIQDLKGIIN
jgi:hypothetical protein